MVWYPIIYLYPVLFQKEGNTIEIKMREKREQSKKEREEKEKKKSKMSEQIRIKIKWVQSEDTIKWRVGMKWASGD